MPRIQEGIEVDVPFWAAYEQWTQPDRFPQFLHHVLAANRIDEDRVRFVTKADGMRREFIARMFEERPDRSVSWSNTDGSTFCEVSLEAISHDRTRVEMSALWDGTSQAGQTGCLFRLTAADIREDLEAFKEYVERRLWDTRANRGLPLRTGRHSRPSMT